MDRQHEGERTDEDHRREILAHVEGQCLVETGVHEVVRERHQQGVAVRRSSRCDLNAGDPVGAGAIVDQDLLAPSVGEPGRNVACKGIGATTLGGRDDDLDGLFGVSGSVGKCACH